MRIPFIDGPPPRNVAMQQMSAHEVLHLIMDDDSAQAAELITASLRLYGLDWAWWAIAHWTDVLIRAAHQRGMCFSGYDSRGRGVVEMSFVRDPGGPLVATYAKPGELIEMKAVPPMAVKVVNWFVARENDDIEGARKVLTEAMENVPEPGRPDFVSTCLTMCADNLKRIGGCPL
jgi:hypothetical protein